MSNEVEQRVLTMTDKRNLEKELEELRQAKLDVAEEIKIDRGHGDLSENAEYDEAKNRSLIHSYEVSSAVVFVGEVHRVGAIALTD